MPSKDISVNIKSLGKVKNMRDLETKLGAKYAGMWVTILKDGTIVARDQLKDLYAALGEPEKLTFLLHVPKKGQLYRLSAIASLLKPAWKMAG